MTATPAGPFDAEDLFENATFANLDIDAAVVSGKEFYRCAFKVCRLPNARFNRCAFEACVFEDCDLSHLQPASAALHGVVFRGCKLVGAELSRVAANPDVSFERCILRYVAFADLNLRGTTFRGCELQDAQFTECSLVEATVAECELAGASFSRCDLSGADFSSSRGVYLEPRGNTLKGTLVPVETAVMLAQAAGLLVDGYDDKPKAKARRR